MGLLDNILGGGQRGGRGGPSAMTLALMALLAYRTYHGKGRLADMMGRGSQGSGVPGAGGAGTGGAQPDGGAQRAGGGLGDILGNIFGGQQPGRAGSAGGGLGELLRGGGGGLGALLGGAAGGGFLGAGLNEIISRLQQNGQGDTANSWVGAGQNKPVSPDQLELAFGRDTLQELSTETGKPYAEVLAELSRGLPDTVDRLTPEGRLPTSEEQERWL
jgi:uncharacterized protein YidB (DUF937 family)